MNLSSDGWCIRHILELIKKNAKSGPTEPFQKCSTVNFKYKILQITNFSISHSELKFKKRIPPPILIG